MSELFKTTSVFDWNYLEYLKKDFKIIVNSGGTYCFGPGQQVLTRSGPIPISKVKIGDEVLSFDGENDVYKTVTDTMIFDNTKPTVRVKLKNGKEIICTEDHKFFFRGEWQSIKYILSLLHD
jgi:intein/homing endonuclease